MSIFIRLISLNYKLVLEGFFTLLGLINLSDSFYSESSRFTRLFAIKVILPPLPLGESLKSLTWVALVSFLEIIRGSKRLCV